MYNVSSLTFIAAEVMGLVYALTQMCVLWYSMNGSFHPSSCCIDEVLPAHMVPVVLIHELARTVFNPNTTLT